MGVMGLNRFRALILPLRLPVVASRRWLSSKVATCAMRGLESN